MTDLRREALSSRWEIDGTAISNTIHHDKCHGCGMGLCSPREWHPQVACDVFSRSHDSRAVWRSLLHAVKVGDPNVAGAERLHEVFYG